MSEKFHKSTKEVKKKRQKLPSRVEEGRNKINKRAGKTQKTKMPGRIPARGST